jgi:predicted  nucleic acid-binding Zn-ribbon protein
MKNIIMFLLSAIPLLASNINSTAPVAELTNYGADFTDTDGDGMTDVAELRYGFNPNDKNSYPSTDYTVLSEFSRPQLHESTGVDDPKNELRFVFTSADYALNRKGLSNYDKLTSDREFLNLAMPILLHELGAPPESFFIEIRCQNRGVYANGYKISVNDDSGPTSFLHEIGHAWKRGWDYSFMNGKNRRYMRGFEEGFAEALVYHIQNRFVEAYPNHPLVKSKMITGRNAQTWRGDVYNFDVTLGEKALRGGTFFGDRFTQYRYENSSGAFSVMANQRDGVLKDLLQAYYTKISEGSWDRTLDVQETFDLWANVLPTVNGIDTKSWLNRVGLFNGKPAPQELYVSLIDEKVFILYPDSGGNFSWKHGTPSSQNIPSWFPIKNDGGKYTPNVGGIAFNLNVKTLNGEDVVSLSRKTNSGTLGETRIDEIAPHNLPVGLYRASVEVPFFASQSPNNKTMSYIIGGKHTNHPHDKLSVHVGLDIPNAEKIQVTLKEQTYTTPIVNGLAIFRFNDVGIDFTGSVLISVTASGKTLEYKRAISHFGLGSGQRLNQFLIVDTDLDNIEDAYDSDVVGLQSKTFVKFSEIQSNAEQIANPTTSVVTQSNDDLSSKPKPKLPSVPTTPPSATNPIVELETKIKKLELELGELIAKNANLKTAHDITLNEVNDLKNEIQTLKLLLATESAKSASLTKSLATSTSQNQTLTIKVNNLESEISDTSVKTENKVKFLQQQIVDLNTTIADLNKTLVEYESNATNYGSVVLKVESQNKELQLKNEELLKKIADLESELKESNSASSVLVQQNTNLADKVVDYTDRINAFASANESLNDSVDSLTDVNTRLTKELEEAIRVAQVPFTSGWFYDPEDGWLYTDANTFPLIYKHSTESWYFYELGSHDSRYFFSYKTNEWEEWK